MCKLNISFSLFIIIVVTPVPAFLEVEIIEDNVEVFDTVCVEQIEHIREDILACVFIPADQQNK